MARRDVFNELKKLRDRMDRAIDELFTREDIEDLYEDWREPLADISEDDDNIYINLELPGVKRDDINLNVTEDSLEVEVESRQEEVESNREYRRIERSHQGFYRYFDLPTKIDTENVEAEFEDGILTITMEKSEEDKKKKKKVSVK